MPRRIVVLLAVAALQLLSGSTVGEGDRDGAEKLSKTSVLIEDAAGWDGQEEVYSPRRRLGALSS